MGSTGDISHCRRFPSECEKVNTCGKIYALNMNARIRLRLGAARRSPHRSGEEVCVSSVHTKRRQRPALPAVIDPSASGSAFHLEPAAASAGIPERPPGVVPPMPVLASAVSVSTTSHPPASPVTADPPGAVATAVETPPMVVPAGIRMLGGTIAWLSGSVAGISAIFYAFGYLITLANLNMLGLDPLAFRYDPAFYVERGASFLFLIAVDAAQSLWYFWPVALAAIVAFLSCRILAGRCRTVATRRPFRTVTDHPQCWRVPVYLLLLCLLGVQMRTHFWFPEQMTVSGVLYSATDAGPGSLIRQWIVERDQSRLQTLFSALVYQQITIGVLLLLVWAFNRAWRWGLLMTAPFAAVFVISVAWLPFEYGKLALPNKFPQVLIRLEHAGEPGSAQPGVMYLLNKTDSEFVLWDARRRSIVWLPNRTLASAEMLESRSLSELVKVSVSAAQ